MSKNDERVLQLKKLIETKKAELFIQKFVPITNCVLDMEDKKYNLNVLQEKELEFLMVKLNAYAMSADNLKIDLVISGYGVNEWLTDISRKLAIITDKKKRDELKALEAKLDKMLSDEKKTELELDEIATLLKQCGIQNEGSIGKMKGENICLQ